MTITVNWEELILASKEFNSVNTTLTCMQMMCYYSYQTFTLLYLSGNRSLLLTEHTPLHTYRNRTCIVCQNNLNSFFLSSLLCWRQHFDGLLIPVGLKVRHLFLLSPATQNPNLSFTHPFQPMESLLSNISSTSTTGPLLPPDPTNCSAWDQRWGAPYLHRLAHLDVQLYHDFYAVWVSLMVRQDTR